MLGCGRCFGGRFPVIFGRQVGVAGMVAGSRPE